MKPIHQTMDLSEIREAGFIFPVRLVGDQAREALESTSNWRLLAAFPRGVYCRNQRGGLVFLGSPSIGAGPLNALCDVPEGWNWLREGFHPAMPVCSDGKTFWVDGRFGFPFEEASPWRMTGGPSNQCDIQAIAERIPLLSREAAKMGRSDGFAPLIPCFSEMVREPSYTPNPLIRAAWPGLQSLFHWLKGGLAAGSRDFSSGIDEEAVKGVIGLGPGLTPSGDDLLGGVMIALHMLGRKGLAEELGRIVLCHARTCTNTVSLAHLTCAAQGEGSEALYDAIVALGVENDQRLLSCLDKIGSIGATSGWDAMAGVFLVIKAMPEKSSPERCAGIDFGWSA